MTKVGSETILWVVLLDFIILLFWPRLREGQGLEKKEKRKTTEVKDGGQEEQLATTYSSVSSPKCIYLETVSNFGANVCSFTTFMSPVFPFLYNMTLVSC